MTIPHNRFFIVPPRMALLLILALSSFASSLEDCMVCSWPYTAGVNSVGKCYPTYSGYQSGLSASCFAYCNTWQNQADTLQPMSSVWRFTDATTSSAPYCECVRLNKGAFATYKVRPQGVCDWGYSDELQNYYDSAAVNHRFEKTDSVMAVMPKLPELRSFWNQIKEFAAAGYDYGGCQAIWHSVPGAPPSPGEGIFYIDFSGGDYRYVNVPLPAGYSCADFLSGNMTSSSTGMIQLLENQKSADTALSRISSGVDALRKSATSTQSSILDAIAHSDSAILSKISTVGGGSSDVDLSGVYTAISDSRDSTVRAIADASQYLGRKMQGVQDSIMNDLRKKDTASASRHAQLLDSLTGIAGELNTVGNKIGVLTDTVSSGNSKIVSQLTYLSDSVSHGTSRTVDAIDGFVRGVDSLLSRGYDLDAATKIVFDSMYSLGKSQYGVSRQSLDSSVAGFNRLHNDFKTLGDSISKLRGDSSGSDSAILGRILDTLHATHTTNKSIIDSLHNWESRYNSIADSVRQAWNTDSLMHSDPYRSIDTAGIAEQAANYYRALRTAASAESSYVADMTPPGTCTDFPSDPTVRLNMFVGPQAELTIPIVSQHRTALVFMRSIIYLIAYVLSFIIWYVAVRYAIDLNRWGQTSKGRVI